MLDTWCAGTQVLLANTDITTYQAQACVLPQNTAYVMHSVSLDHQVNLRTPVFAIFLQCTELTHYQHIEQMMPCQIALDCLYEQTNQTMLHDSKTADTIPTIFMRHPSPMYNCARVTASHKPIRRYVTVSRTT